MINTDKELSSSVYVGGKEPTGNDRKKVWIQKGKNLFDKNNATILIKYLDKNTGEILETSGARMFIIKCKPLTTYTISKVADKRFRVGTTSIYPATGIIVDNFIVDETATSITITTDINAKYLCVFYTDTTQDTLSEEEIRNSIQVEYGTEATNHEEYVDTTLNIKENDSFSEILNIDQILKEVIPKNAGAHNAIYRGKDITNLFYNGTLSQQIAAETFDDIFVGDYIIGKVSGRKYLVADINYRLHMGDTECTTNHILMIPEKIMGKARMNTTNTTEGAYVNSDMYKTNLEQFKTIIRNDFETNHILTHRNYLKNAISNGYESGGAWYNSDIELMTEYMVFGNGFYHNVISGTNFPNNFELDNSQLSLFRLKRDLIADNEKWYWLRNVVSSESFADVDRNGLSDYANSGNWGGVRPAFLIY